MNEHDDNTVLDFKGFTDGEYGIHEAAALFPGMRLREYRELKRDIHANGQRVPISVFRNQVVDGRHRLRACRELGIDPLFESVNEIKGSVGAYVVSMNLHRRHLTDSQRGMIAASLASLKLGANQHTAHAVSQAQAAKALNVSVDTLQRAKKVRDSGHRGLIDAVETGDVDVSNAAALITLSREELDKLVESRSGVRAKEMSEKARELKKQAREAARETRLHSCGALRAKSQPLDPSIGPFNLIYADPPWDYIDEAVLGYPTMSVEQICEMPVKDVANTDAVLFLWVPASLIRQGLKVIEAWGFRYITQAIWAKDGSGQGQYFRVNHEVLLLATRGYSLPEVPPSARLPSVFSYPRREHSQKPDEFYDVIERMYPELPKLELFHRGVTRAGWYMWGNEVQHGPAQIERSTAGRSMADEINETMGRLVWGVESANDGQVTFGLDLATRQAA
ncbi:hypothetical protein AWB69_03971 [Caballeronia udeis]|uniref:Uncharacterized protein n=1 Tax=Caballeronia udeis TaxID=1232866 RepID=A0A158H5T5_9BURK|nr:MT-A70 family methyltransferase [Caballeronia udeis]SAL39656.1 hypothetical protein AWB69_03971 [Caballeronia udeis]